MAGKLDSIPESLNAKSKDHTWRCLLDPAITEVWMHIRFSVKDEIEYEAELQMRRQDFFRLRDQIVKAIIVYPIHVTELHWEAVARLICCGHEKIVDELREIVALLHVGHFHIVYDLRLSVLTIDQGEIKVFRDKFVEDMLPFI